MKKYLVKTIVINLLLGSTAHAYIQAGVQNLTNPQAILKKAQSEGVTLSKTERLFKREIVSQRGKPGFKEQVFEGELSNTPDYQSYLYEVYVGLPHIDEAKILVRYQFEKIIKDRWSQIKNTLINESAVESYDSFLPNLERRLMNIYFSPIKVGHRIKVDDYRFRIEDWGFAIVSKDLKKITWKISISANNDFNKLEPGADLIKVKSRSSNQGFPTFENSKSNGTFQNTEPNNPIEYSNPDDENSF